MDVSVCVSGLDVCLTVVVFSDFGFFLPTDSDVCDGMCWWFAVCEWRHVRYKLSGHANRSFQCSVQFTGWNVRHRLSVWFVSGR